MIPVAEAGDAVLAPAIGAAARLVVAEKFPGVAVFAVVLAHRAPLPLADIRPPDLPGHAVIGVEQALAFGGLSRLQRPQPGTGLSHWGSPAGVLVTGDLSSFKLR